MNLDLGFGFALYAYGIDGKPVVSCRIDGINAPELKKKASLPDGPGEEALAYAEQICPPGTFVTIVSTGWDKYGGRFDGKITLPDGSDFGQRMLNAGQAVPYSA